MQLAAVLGVSTSESAICVVARSDGSMAFETTVPTEPEAIAAAPERVLNLRPDASQVRADFDRTLRIGRLRRHDGTSGFDR
jgi:hypothetical protein